MKWLFALLVVANLLMLGWGMQREGESSIAEKPMRPGIGNLRLLSELPAEGKEGSISNPLTSELDGPDRQTLDVPQIPDKKNPQVELDVESTSDLVEKKDAVTDVPESEAVVDAEITPAEETPPETIPEPVLVCGAFGPFEQGPEARRVAESLESRGFDASHRREELERPVGYWVLIPPMESREQAVEKVSQLRSSGISDVRRFVKGEHRNGISLGVFSSKTNALRRQREVARKGHASRIIPRMIAVPTYWVDFRSVESQVEIALRGLRDEFPELKHEQYPCSRVVTSGGIF